MTSWVHRLLWKPTPQMGKKGAKASAKGQEEATTESEGPGLTGMFASDFPLLCEQSGLPAVAVQTIHASRAEETDPDTHHAVLVEYAEEEEGEGETSQLKALHIRGWLLSEQVATLLREALATTQLTTLNLWNVGLTPSTLQMVAELVQQQNIRRLVVDGNPVTAEPLVQLLQSRLQHLSLKCCGVSANLLSALRLPLSENRALMFLDLSCNQVGDEGVHHLASALRMNRTLLSLALANNKIGDKGATLLAEVLSRFALNHEEIVTRRKLLSRVRRQEDGQSLLDAGREVSPRRSPSSTSLDKSGKSSRLGKAKKGDGKKEEKGKKGSGGADAKKGKTKEGKGAKKGGPEAPLSSPRPEPAEAVNPLVEVGVEEEDGRLVMPGNMALVHLTLSYNCISDVGVSALLQAVKTQQQYPHLGPGLFRVTLQHNLSNSGDLKELAALLQSKDPLRSTEHTHTETDNTDLEEK